MPSYDSSRCEYLMFRALYQESGEQSLIKKNILYTITLYNITLYSNVTSKSWLIYKTIKRDAG